MRLLTLCSWSSGNGSHLASDHRHRLSLGPQRHQCNRAKHIAGQFLQVALIPSTRLTASQLTRLLGQRRTMVCSNCEVPRLCALQAGIFTSAGQWRSIANAICIGGAQMIRIAFRARSWEKKEKGRREWNFEDLMIIHHLAELSHRKRTSGTMITT